MVAEAMAEERGARGLACTPLGSLAAQVPSSFSSELLSEQVAVAEGEKAEAAGQGCRARGRPVFDLLASESRRVPSCVSDEPSRQRACPPLSLSHLLRVRQPLAEVEVEALS